MNTPNDMKKNISEVLTRGVAEVLPGADTLQKLMETKKIRVYLGIDPTGSLLTLGHSVVLRKLQQFAELGHEVILLIGNGTVRIGDPTGKDSTRPELTDKQIEKNFKNWKEQASKILDFNKIEIKYNGEWLDKLDMAKVIKLMAKTTVQQLMERDMFQKRLEEGKPIHGHEIMYPLLQGYDSVAMDVDLEIGGTDQTFNMMMGRTLQKSYNNREKWVLTAPIINGTDGRKMSKSYDNFIALTEAPNDMYGKLMSIADEMIIQYFTLLTDISLEEIAKIERGIADGENPMTFKKLLALTITQMYHNAEAAEAAAENFKSTVQDKSVPSDAPTVLMSTMDSGATITTMVKLAEPEKSNSDIRRLIEQGAVSIDGQKMTDPNEKITPKSGSILKTGKRSFYKIK
jgi:tyrosyl-tRNA synthetase